MSWGHSSTRSWKVIKYVDLRSQPSRVIMESDLAVNLCKESRLLTLSQGNTVIEQIPLCAPSPTVVYRDTAIVFTLALSSLFIKFRIRLSNVADRCSLCLALSEFTNVQESIPAQNAQCSRGFKDVTCLSQGACSSGSSSQVYQLQNDTRSLSSSQRSFYMLESQSSPHPDLRSVFNPITIKKEEFTNSPSNSQSPLKCFSPFSPMPSQSCLSTPVKLEVHEKGTQTECLDEWCTNDEQLEAELTRLMRSPQFMSLVKKIQRIWPKLQMTGAGNGF
ncbi:unnamed protein product [Cylicocyclus nassatus]|uniref:Uncharacterized protein n=1 Tax=Cylicocyclus nassatus TaxID=53992 RepID=A0AA36GKS0_CYLNA|nr:unnamed protein product [Cylicocyclus nassatus]